MTKRQKLEKNKRKRRFFSILMILVTGLILSASTYAWFTANKNVDVEAMEVNVSASTGLQISAKPVADSDWKTYVSATDFNAVNTNQLPSSISPVSTIGEVADSTSATASVPKGRMFMYRGSLNNQIDSSTHDETFYLTTSESTEGTGSGTTASTGGDYLAFDLYIRSGVDGTVYLKSPSKVTLNNGTSTEKGKGIENATRVAFVMEGLNTNSNVLFDTVSSYECSSNNSITNSDGKNCYAYTIWEPNSTSHTTTGLTSAANTKTFGYTNADLYNSDGSYKALTYYGIGSAQKNIPFASTSGLVNDTTSQSYFSAVTTQKSENDIDDTARIPAFEVKVGVNKVRIYVWVEGQDVDCEDKASDSTISVDLAFSLENKA